MAIPVYSNINPRALSFNPSQKYSKFNLIIQVIIFEKPDNNHRVDVIVIAKMDYEL